MSSTASTPVIAAQQSSYSGSSVEHDQIVAAQVLLDALSLLQRQLRDESRALKNQIDLWKDVIPQEWQQLSESARSLALSLERAAELSITDRESLKRLLRELEGRIP